MTNHYLKGQTLFFQGAPPFGLYCIHDGKVKITKTGPEGKESIVRIARPGDILGHRSLFSRQNFTGTATALEDTAVCFFDKKLIYEALQAHPSISLHIIERLSKEMGAAQNMNASLSQKTVRERLAELLLSLRANYGIQEEDRIKLDIRITRIEIASMIGTASETVIRFISEFKNEGLIHQEGKTIYLLKEDGLRKAANASRL